MDYSIKAYRDYNLVYMTKVLTRKPSQSIIIVVNI